MSVVGLFFNPKILLIMLLVLGFWFGLQAIRPSIPSISTGVSGEVDHANTAHGVNGDQADNCFHQHGFKRIYQAYDRPNKRMTFHFICQDDNGSFFDYIMGDKGFKLSSFTPGNGSLDEITNWIFRKEMSKMISFQQLPEAVIESMKTMQIPNLP